MPMMPIGRKPGCKLDKWSKIMDRCASIRETNITIIPENYWDELSSSQWHQIKTERYLYTSDQNGIGDCAAESKDNTKHALDTFHGQPLIIYNPLGTYYTTSGGRDNGSVIGDNLEFGREKGCFPEEVWSRSNGWKKQPSNEAYEIASYFKIREFFYVEDIKEFVSALLQGYYVHAGYSGHAVSFCCYMGRGVLKFKNSWGDWGENGFGTLKASQINFGYGAYAYKDIVPYYDMVTKKFLCPWTPAKDQLRLAAQVNRFEQLKLNAKLQGRRWTATQEEQYYNSVVT